MQKILSDGQRQLTSRSILEAAESMTRLTPRLSLVPRKNRGGRYNPQDAIMSDAKDLAAMCCGGMSRASRGIARGGAARREAFAGVIEKSLEFYRSDIM